MFRLKSTFKKKENKMKFNTKTLGDISIGFRYIWSDAEEVRVDELNLLAHYRAAREARRYTPQYYSLDITECTVHVSGIDFIGEAVKHPTDPHNVSKARGVALANAIEDLSREQRMEIWEAWLGRCAQGRP